MSVIAVVAHARKNLGDGLAELKQVLALAGYPDPIWHEVNKSRKAEACTASAIRRSRRDLRLGRRRHGATLRGRAGRDAGRAGDYPAGTANLLATSLGIPADIEGAVGGGLTGRRRKLDTGSVNGEHFAVMAGAGFDARMIKQADRKLKRRLGRAAYLYAAARTLRADLVRAVIKVDGKPFFKGRASCVLAGNIGTILGGIEAFPPARPDDGLLELGVVTAKNPAQWARVLARLAKGSAAESPFAHVTRGRRIVARFEEPVRYELDGGARDKVRKLRIAAHPASVTVCVPADQV